MKKSILLLILIIPFNIFAQEVKNVQFHQQDDRVIITYDLIANKRGYFDVTAFYTIDNGKTFIPLKSTSGDIGKDIKKGENKIIVWNVLNDIENGIINTIQFKIVADYYKPKIEDYLIGKYSTLPPTCHGGGDYSLLNYGWFSSPAKKGGMLLSVSFGNYYYDYDAYYLNHNNYIYNIGIDFGLMHKLVNSSKFKLIFYEQIGLYSVDQTFLSYSKGMDKNTFNENYSYNYNDFIIEEEDFDYFDIYNSDFDRLKITYKENNKICFPFPISTGLIFNINCFDILIGIKIYNNETKKFKELDKHLKNIYNYSLEYIPPDFNVGISFGIGYTF